MPELDTDHTETYKRKTSARVPTHLHTRPDTVAEAFHDLRGSMFPE